MQIIRYLMVGGIASIVDIGLFVLFAKFIGYNYILVAACSFVIATGVNYQLSVRHVFESTIRHTRKKEVLLVYFVSLVGLLINLIILYLAVSIFLFEMVLSKIFASGLVFFWNYFIRKYYIF
jgi:putative flippase GtrA